jgi:hypothetical protein
VEETAALTNKERRDNVAYLLESYRVERRRPPSALDTAEVEEFVGGDDTRRQRLFFKLLCYAALAAQPAPEAVVHADWERLVAAGVVDDVFNGEFDLASYSLDPPVSRGDSKGRIIDFTRLAVTREVWAQLLPEPTDAEVTVDTLRATSGGALKSRAFWVVREMRRHGLWGAEQLDLYAYVPDGRVRKRAIRSGLVDLPEKADTFADMKTMSRGLHAVMRLAGQVNGDYDLPVSQAAERCEICDAGRMASCAMPHCLYRRQQASVG